MSKAWFVGIMATEEELKYLRKVVDEAHEFYVSMCDDDEAQDLYCRLIDALGRAR